MSKGRNNEMEGWAALAVSILRNVSCERAFDLLSGSGKDCKRGRYRRWNSEEKKALIEMFVRGYDREAVGDYFGVPGKIAQTRFNKFVRDMSISDRQLLRLRMEQTVGWSYRCLRRKEE